MEPPLALSMYAPGSSERLKRPEVSVAILLYELPVRVLQISIVVLYGLGAQFGSGGMRSTGQVGPRST